MINQCNFIGRLGRDPETRYTQSGKAVASFSLACSEKRGGEESTEWINVVAWEKLAEICGQYLTKGSLVFISGRMQTRKWQDKEGGWSLQCRKAARCPRRSVLALSGAC